MFPLALALLALAQSNTATTAHYTLRVDADRLEARELGALLEQAWPIFRGFFKAEPKLDREERLALSVHFDRERWLEALLAERATLPSDARLAWFAPNTRAVHVERQLSEYVTRALAIYGACLQFHALSKTKNRDLDTWYVRGLAESFATHAWDGETLKLGISPRICMIDYPATAMDELGGERFGLDVWTVERLQSPYVRWCAVRFALEGAGGKYRPKLEKLALGHTGSKISGEDFMRSLGREKDIAPEFHEWLRRAQMPFEVLSGEFEDYADGRIVGRLASSTLAIACARGRAGELRVSFEPPRASSVSVGVVLSADGVQEYKIFRIDPPGAGFEHYVRGDRIRVEPIQFGYYDKGLVSIVAQRDGESVLLDVGGRKFGPYAVGEPRLGIAVAGGSMVFRELDAR